MKRDNNHRVIKLRIDRTTMRKLTDTEASQVGGGAETKGCPCTHTSAGPSHPIFC